jgi:hypothetical protein
MRHGPEEFAWKWDCSDHSALMLAVRITLPHFSVSSAINLLKSAGEPGSAVTPNSASRAFILASASAALISLLSLDAAISALACHLHKSSL